MANRCKAVGEGGGREGGTLQVLQRQTTPPREKRYVPKIMERESIDRENAVCPESDDCDC